METQLQIRHIDYQGDQPQFNIVRLPDGKSSPPITLTPPEQITVEGRPTSNLQQEDIVRWMRAAYPPYG